MVPSPSPNFSMDCWLNDPPDLVHVTCLLPNGVFLIQEVCATATIREIKMELLAAAKSYPLYEMLKEHSMYALRGITKFNTVENFKDSGRLCDIQPYLCLLELAESTEYSSDQELCNLISYMIGKSVDDFRAMKSPEVSDFRYKMSLLSEEIENERATVSWSEKLLYEHPLRLARTPRMPTIKGRLRSDSFVVSVKLENDESIFSLRANDTDTPTKLIEMALAKMSRSMVKLNGQSTSSYILRVGGRDEYLFGEFPLIQFVYIQESLSRDGVPLIVLKPIHTLPTYINHKQLSIEYKPKTTENLNYKTSTIRKRQKFASSWDIQEPFRLELHGIDNVNCDLNPTPEIGVHLGLFHGERRLCALQKSTELPVDNDGKIVLNEAIAFDIFLQNVPRSARLCISIYAKTVKLGGSRSKKISTSKESKDSKDSKDNKESAKDNREYHTSPLAWVNTTLFDYKHQLKTGQLTLHTWTNADDIQSDEIFHPLGTVEPNPRNEDCAVVKLTFHNYNCENGIIYPEEETVLLHAEKLAETENLNRSKSQDKKIIQKILASYSRSDKLDEMHDQDRNDIWSNRLDCRNECPEELSILLHCVNWNERNEVAEIWSLLKDWPTVSVERSLELLDYAYPDPAVRNFSIRCLRQLKDEELLLYLLQLVQAIKHESYLDSDLVCFVLERALRNQRIGHYFFWHLRSEMQTPSMQVRFGLLLDAYLKGCKSHVPLLHKQVQCLEKLKQGSESAKKGSKEKSRHSLQTFLANERIGAVFKGFQSPLNPSFRCKGVKPDKCKVMDSKMRPLWVVFENADMLCDDIYIIFKNGDDLRQDMLTLQMLRVMDQLWKNEGLDFRMNIYNCISMERRLGMIEVVLNAETIANIQKVKGMFSATSPFKKGSLFSWLKEHNNTEEEMNKAVEEFTLSCAGYCVATYVLGVADRHSDNIMVKKNGQLFHIDFGHILGHFKEKFGVRRERVPFVLTHDFVYVINKGRTDREAEEFRYFQKLCEDAFLILREHGCLILSLFSMMISTGLPELSSEKDLNYLKETLVLELTKENAREHFRSKFSEALANSWKTSLNWASHNFSKNNKQ
ncbi:phosphatidylinositol 4,5-bisphosphate 3-kinase catalytic subunit beta isoform [Eupeodes corollae]|uniref:phosphatidylinositol 4,5-bisphosphate 3-kinase catalytic subunit beta isoform n=1 Tax=Eupeodes corollae TaxID=290404 RepID=UPI002491272F|nr:phosphatidylinositol 4,5-bisphosphate 3-kinase catalytic subunit beta isoform [Eupeodes corollae]